MDFEFRTLWEEGLGFKTEKIWFMIEKRRKGNGSRAFSNLWTVHEQNPWEKGVGGWVGGGGGGEGKEIREMDNYFINQFHLLYVHRAQIYKDSFFFDK